MRGRRLAPIDGAPSRAMRTRQPGCGRALADIEDSVRIERNRAKAAAAGRRCRERILKQMQEDPGHEKHGTATGYTYGCRCERCCEAQAERKRKYADRAGASRAESPWAREYGTFKNGWNSGAAPFEPSPRRK